MNEFLDIYPNSLHVRKQAHTALFLFDSFLYAFADILHKADRLFFLLSTPPRHIPNSRIVDVETPYHSRELARYVLFSTLLGII